MRQLKAIIVDDEILNRSLIKDMVQTLNPRYKVCGVADGVENGYSLIKAVEPDVVFVDIKLGDGTGFDLLNRFDEHNFEIVFVTAFDEYSLKAFDFNAIDYILKPINENRFAATLKRIESRLSDVGVVERSVALRQLALTQGIIRKIPVHYRDSVLLLDVNEILSLQADHGCTVFKVWNRGSYTSSKQLSDFEFILERFTFFERINKGVFVNLNYLTSYSKGNPCIVTLRDDQAFEVSRRKKSHIIEILAKYKNAT